jgi:hypothetical protein
MKDPFTLCVIESFWKKQTIYMGIFIGHFPIIKLNDMLNNMVCWKKKEYYHVIMFNYIFIPHVSNIKIEK